jgi:hypothetical protein
MVAPNRRWNTQNASVESVAAGAEKNGVSVTGRAVLRRDREYLRALRQAELAAWNDSTTQKRVGKPATPARVRLPSPPQNRAEGRVYLVLAIMCIAALISMVSGLALRAPQWHNFVQFVRQLVG